MTERRPHDTGGTGAWQTQKSDTVTDGQNAAEVFFSAPDKQCKFRSHIHTHRQTGIQRVIMQQRQRLYSVAVCTVRRTVPPRWLSGYGVRLQSGRSRDGIPLATGFFGGRGKIPSQAGFQPGIFPDGNFPGERKNPVASGIRTLTSKSLRYTSMFVLQLLSQKPRSHAPTDRDPEGDYAAAPETV